MHSEASTLTHVNAELANIYPGRVRQIRQLTTILPAKSPNFLFVHDAYSIDTTKSLLLSVLSSLRKLDGIRPLDYALVDCVACFSARVLYDTVLNALLGWTPSWAEGCRIFTPEAKDSRWNDSLDSFIRGLRHVPSILSTRSENSAPSSSDGNADRKIVIVFNRAEKLRDYNPELFIPLTRLQELTGRDISVVFLSEIEWEHVNLSSGNILDPFRLNVEPPSKQETISVICRRFPHFSQSTLEDIDMDEISCFHPSLRNLFAHFVETLYDVCSPFITDPKELGYIAGAQWPAFASPVLEDWRQQGTGPYFGPSEDGRIRLIRLFTPSLTMAIESLYPRTVSLREWRKLNAPPEGFRLSQSMGRSLPQQKQGASGTEQASALPVLSRLSKFILIASFLASTNPAKSDVRMFARGPDERARYRKKGGGTRKLRQGAVAKVSQRLLGPTTFPYDRLIAILGALLMEYDDREIGSALFVDASGSEAEIEVHRTQTAAAVQELVSMRLLYRTTAIEKIESPVFKCGATHEHVMAIARELSIPLSELVWEQS